MGILCVFCAADLVSTPLGQNLSFGLFVFWCLRLLFQFFVYSPKLWQGKTFETGVHILFVILWTYVSGVFFLASWGG